MLTTHSLRSMLIGMALVVTTQIEAADAMTLRDALEIAATSHPDLAQFPAERGAAEARRSQSARAPATEVRFALEDAAGTGAYSGIDRAQWTLSLSRALERSGQRSSRIAAADARIEALTLQQEQRRREVLGEVAERFIEAAADAERLRLAEAELALAADALSAAEARVAAARAPLAEAARARAAHAMALLEREHAEHEEQSARLALAVSLGRSRPDFGDLVADVYTLPPIVRLETLDAQLERSPAALARLATVATAEAERRAAASLSRARPSFDAGVRRFEAEDDYGLVLGFSMPIGSAARAGDVVREADAEIARLEAEHRATQFDTQHLLFDRFQELRHWREAVSLLDGTVLPALDDSLKQTRYAFERGRYGYPELALALRELAAAKRERLDAAVRYHMLLVELEKLTGMSLINGTDES